LVKQAKPFSIKGGRCQDNALFTECLRLVPGIEYEKFRKKMKDTTQKAFDEAKRLFNGGEIRQVRKGGRR
jgi:hypothetical protein